MEVDGNDVAAAMCDAVIESVEPVLVLRLRELRLETERVSANVLPMAYSMGL